MSEIVFVRESDGRLNIVCTFTHLICVFVSVCQAFNVVFQKAIDRAEPAEEVKLRVNNLIDCITFSVFIYTTRGLFEKDKLIFTAQVAFQVRNSRVDYSTKQLK